MVREYFGARLKELDRESFKAAHSRLYDHYRFGSLPAAFRDGVAYALLVAQSALPDYGAKQIVEVLLLGGRHVYSDTPPTLIKAKPEQLLKAKTLIGGTEWELALKAFSPDNEAGMTPLFTAITHGCAAEREDETFMEVYLPRIVRYSIQEAALRNGNARPFRPGSGGAGELLRSAVPIALASACGY